MLPILERIEARQTNLLRILVYHRVGSPETEKDLLDPALLNARPEMFDRQMQLLKEQYHVVSLDELLLALASNRTLPARSVMVTFDDGYRDFLETAWPVLSELQIPAVLFVATGYLAGEGQLFWWDRLYQGFMRTKRKQFALPEVGTWPLHSQEQRYEAYQKVKTRAKSADHHAAMVLVDGVLDSLDVCPDGAGMLLTWRDLHRLAADGLHIGAHTRSHAILSRMSWREAQAEVLDSQMDLKRELGQTWPVFAYPAGHASDLSPKLTTILQDAGFQAAMTMIPGHNVVGRTHPLRLRRVGMAPHLSMAEFRLVLTRAYDVYGGLVEPAGSH